MIPNSRFFKVILLLFMTAVFSFLAGQTHNLKIIETRYVHGAVLPYYFLIDATMDNKPAGNVSLIEPEFVSDFPKALNAHDLGLKDMIESVTILGTLPKIYLITVTIDTIQSMQMDLSEKIKGAIPEVIEKIDALVSVIR